VATKSVAAQFSSQLRELRSRIDTTVPHYIRCLKPNDELVPDSFDPKMIVDQLRCGGVLEAVRVSRAGYPTRYPHNVFKARYYFLGEREVKSNKSLKTTTPFGRKVSTTNGDEAIKKLISKIAFDIWEAEQSSKEQLESPTPAQVRLCCFGKECCNSADLISPYHFCISYRPQQPRKQFRPDPINGKSNYLAARTAFSSESERKSSQTDEYLSGATQPQTSHEFLALDFSSRCAIAGLQLGRTKVFLRREAFDRIEALRAGKFGKSAVTIQKMARGMQARAAFRLSCSSIRHPKQSKSLRDHMNGSLSSMRDVYMRTASSMSVDSRNDSEAANEPGTMELRTLKSVQGKFQVWPPLKRSDSVIN
jgi:myosin heavy subunit